MPENNRQSANTQSDRLSINALREMKALRTLKRKGHEEHCDFCRISISCLDAAIEVAASLHGHPMTLHFHSRCHRAWKSLR